MAEQETIVKTAPDDTVRGYIGGSIRYRTPHVYEINDKKIPVGFGFIVSENGKKMNLSANAIDEIVRLYREDPKLREHLESLPRIEQFSPN